MNRSPALEKSIASLISAEQMFQASELSPLAHGRAREAAICAGIDAIATSFGVTLKRPLSIDSRGDISIVALAEPGKENKGFGKEFADLLTFHQVRCGQNPGAHLTPEAGWGFLNHFSAEKLVRHVAGIQAQAESPEPADMPNDRPTV